MSDRVLLLHGIARTSASLGKLERSLAAAGFLTLNLNYASRARPLQDLAEEVREHARPFMSRDHGRLHIVTHSMGGLVARALLARGSPRDLGRVVMLAPPNQGSEVADLLEGTSAYARVFGPAGPQQTTAPGESVCRLLGKVDYPLGVIAGDRAVDPLGWLVIPGPNDGKVSVARTRVEGMTDHVTIHATHALMMRNPRVIGEVIHFLRHGRFTLSSQREPAGCPSSPVSPNAA